MYVGSRSLLNFIVHKLNTHSRCKCVFKSKCEARPIKEGEFKRHKERNVEKNLNGSAAPFCWCPRDFAMDTLVYRPLDNHSFTEIERGHIRIRIDNDCRYSSQAYRFVDNILEQLDVGSEHESPFTDNISNNSMEILQAIMIQKNMAKMKAHEYATTSTTEAKERTTEINKKENQEAAEPCKETSEEVPTEKSSSDQQCDVGKSDNAQDNVADVKDAVCDKEDQEKK